METTDVVGLIIGIFISIILISYYILAPRNILITFGMENRCMFIMRGKKFSGKVILPSFTLFIDSNFDVKTFDGSLPQGEKKKDFLGMHWIGIPPFYSIYTYHFQWLEWKSESDGKRSIKLRNEDTPYLICKPFEYAMVAEEAEDINGMPLDIYFTVTLMPTNVLLATFGNDNAYGQVQTKCISQVLLFAKEKTFSSLGGDNQTPNVTQDEFSTLLLKLNNKIPGSPEEEGITKVLGYKITDAKLDKVEVAGDNKQKLLDASTVAYVAKENANAEVEKARGMKAVFDVQEEYYDKISKIEGAMKVEERKATPGLTTLVEAGSKKKTGIIVGGGK